MTGGCLCSVAACARWLPVLGGICIPTLLFQCLEMLFREHIHPVFTFLKREDYYFQPDSSLQTKSSRQGCIASGFFIPAERIFPPRMHRPEIFHPCRQNLLARDASPRDFSSLQTESSWQGCIAPGFFIPADKIFSAGMHRPGIFHPCRKNLPIRDASPPQLCPQDCRTPHHLIKPTVPIFKLSAFPMIYLFPVSAWKQDLISLLFLPIPACTYQSRT